MQRARKRAMAILATVVLTACVAGVYFGYFNPVTDHINRGLDLAGGIHVIMEAVSRDGEPASPEAIKAAVHTIRRRVDALGVVEPRIYPEGENRIIVELPGVDDPEMALDVIGRTAYLEFMDPSGQEVIVTGAHLERAYPNVVEQPGRPAEPVVQLEFDTEGSRLVADAMRRHAGEQIVIRLDGEVIMTPWIQSAPRAGETVRPYITGYQTIKDAEAVAIMLNSGALPVELRTLRPRFVSATLGEESISQSFQAALLGGAAIVAFMVLLYRVPGVWAVLALSLYLLLVLSILAGINATLTLPGIAGLILSIGMAVDANVIIFERIREELAIGKTVRAAIRSGFRQAFRAILDANVTTLIAASILYWQTTGPIRGFAVTLAIGIIVSMITAFLVTRQLLVLSVDAGLVNNAHRMFRVKEGSTS